MYKLLITILLASCGVSGPQTPKAAITQSTKHDVYCEPLNQNVYYCIEDDRVGYWCTYEQMKWTCVSESK
jgi:hypothetical protein